MGVDFYPCTKCGDVFSDCGYFRSCDCGARYCGDCAYGTDALRKMNRGGKRSASLVTWYEDEDDVPNENDCDDHNACIACTQDPARRAIVTDKDLIKWLIVVNRYGNRERLQSLFIEKTLAGE